MRIAVVDDSGSGGDSPWYVLAGYVSTGEAWAAFDPQWRAVLDADPKIEYFKASEAESLRPEGQWAGVTKARRDAKINELIGVVSRCAEKAFHVRVLQKDYDEIFKSYVPPRWDNPYYTLFQSCVSLVVADEKYRGEGSQLELIFDGNKTFEKPSLRLYGQVKDIPVLAGWVSKISYRDEKSFLPLQAADLLAWQIRRRLCVTTEPPREQYERALHHPKRHPLQYTVSRKDLLDCADAMEQDARRKWAAMGRPEEERPWRR